MSVPARAAFAVDDRIQEIVVTSRRQQQDVLRHTGNVEILDARQIDAVSHQHAHELMTRVPGVWIVRGSGQEHLTAIRSPVVTGAGSCGGFLYLEDGIPIRPAGFCNVNQLFEINTEQARSIEVIRGPGNALYGSNALHGTINVIQPSPRDRPPPYLSLEVGANGFFGFQGEAPFDPGSRYYAGLVYAVDGGFRDDSGYRQLKLNLKTRGRLIGGDMTLALAVTGLDQETAGFIVGQDAYRDPSLNRDNLNPEAFRDATSQRLYGLWSRSLGRAALDIRPYLRHSDMTFLQHFLPGQPLEENGQVSAGMLSAITVTTARHSTVAGVDVEWSNAYLKETQAGPTEGSDFLRATRPPGKHYDYRVQSTSFAPYFQSDFEIGTDLTISAGLRAEYVRYEYDNRMASGNTRDDGTPCASGGCLYSRPADRGNSFVNFAPKLAASYRLSSTTTAYVAAARGFRAPQTTELYRLQSGQAVADLDSEEMDSIEIGVRHNGGAMFADLSVFAMRKKNSIFRDAQGFNVSGAGTRHDGIEAALDWQMHAAWRFSVDVTYARHRYDFDSVAARGETFVAGRDVDTAPRWVGSAELVFDGGGRFRAALQSVRMGRYFLDAENRFSYPGHSLMNLRASFDVSDRLTLTARLNNAMDEAYADRADYAFGNYRYFPGRGREVFVELRYAPHSAG